MKKGRKRLEESRRDEEHHGREYRRMEERGKLDRAKERGSVGNKEEQIQIIDLPQFAENILIRC